MKQTKAIKDIDPRTNKEILRFPTFGRFNLHAYYSRIAFSSNTDMIATSTPYDQTEELKRGMSAPGSVQIMTFPEGEVYMTINDVSVPMHGGRFEFSRTKEVFVLQLGENEMGFVHLQTKKIHKVPIKGDLKSFGEDKNSFIAITINKDGLWLYRLNNDGTIIIQKPLALYEDMQRLSPFNYERGNGMKVVVGNEKISDSGYYFMYVRRLMDEQNTMFTKQLIVIDLRNGESFIPYDADISDYSVPAHAFHHAAWVNGKDTILLHAMLEGKSRLVFKLFDVMSKEEEILFPAFGAKGHHSVMTSDEKVIITDSYIGDLDGMVSAIDLLSGSIHPLATWNVDDLNRVEGHPSLSPDQKWILYDCNVDGGSEVRAVKLKY